MSAIEIQHIPNIHIPQYIDIMFYKATPFIPISKNARKWVIHYSVAIATKFLKYTVKSLLTNNCIIQNPL